MTDSSFRLRAAARGDAYALWIWANDPETRIASHGRGPISWSDHVAWLREQLESPESAVLIAEGERDQPMGSARFDTADGWVTARFSYVLASEARGRRLSASLVAAAMEWLRLLRPATTVVAEVLMENERSMRVFRALGWEESGGASGDVRRFRLRRRTDGAE